MSNKKKRRRKIFLLVIIFLIIISVILYYLVFYKNPTEKKTIDEIANVGYKLEDRDTKLMKDTFSELKTVLQKDEIDFDKYAILLSKLFIIDLYTIDNKIDSYDIGGLEYVYPDDANEYKAHVKNTLYNYIGSIENRTEKMPEVKKITSEIVSKGEFKYGYTEYESYTLKLSWEYVKDLGYDENGYVTLIKSDDKLYVAQFSVEGDQDE